MKRLTASLLLAAFAFLLAPSVPDLRQSPLPPAVAVAGNPFKIMFGEDDAEEPRLPELKRPHLAKGEHWVPLIRFANTRVEEDSVRKVVALIEQAGAAGAEAIVLEISTPGGSVDDGREFSRAIERSRVPVHCVVDGEAASMGFYILQSCPTRSMTRRSLLMAHEPAIAGSMHGKPTEWHNIAVALAAISEAMMEHEAHRLKVSKDYLRHKIEHGQDWWILPAEALVVGAVDDVVESVASVQASYQHHLRPPRRSCR